MKFALDQAIVILQRTPGTIKSLIENLGENWTNANEGPETFSPFDVVGHLIYGEKTDWVVRAKIILQGTNQKTFEPFDRFAQERESKGKSLNQLLTEFEFLRNENIYWLNEQNLSTKDLERTGIHPTLGAVSLKHLLACWVVHDLTHIAQITRVMAKQYKDEIGPWTEFFRILNF
ncbi:MAG TPA: DinB family protein [Chitinophagaceae bacterium]|nr:DinB family protein [Chitinophagaceae bacterium]HNO55034.1 DinB family protein [Chitinophagaceae bacterium]